MFGKGGRFQGLYFDAQGILFHVIFECPPLLRCFIENKDPCRLTGNGKETVCSGRQHFTFHSDVLIGFKGCGFISPCSPYFSVGDQISPYFTPLYRWTSMAIVALPIFPLQLSRGLSIFLCPKQDRVRIRERERANAFLKIWYFFIFCFFSRGKVKINGFLKTFNSVALYQVLGRRTRSGVLFNAIRNS